MDTVQCIPASRFQGRTDTCQCRDSPSVHLYETWAWDAKQDRTEHKYAKGVNRTLQWSLPRNVTWSRNFPGQAHIHSLNHGSDVSLQKLCDSLGAPVPTGSRVDRELKSTAKKKSQIKVYHRTQKYNASKKEKWRKLFQLYEKHHEDMT